MLLHCRITAIHDGGATGCNLTAEPVARPDGEAYIPSISCNSRFFEILPAFAPPAPLPGLPYLFIEDHGPNDTVLSGGRSTPFIWDPELRRHVHRFASIEDFNERARDIINDEPMWKIFVGIEAVPAAAVPAAGPALLAEVPEEALKRELSRREGMALLAVLGADHLSPELLEKYAHLIEASTGRPVDRAAETQVKLISDAGDWGFQMGIGFQVRIGEDFARAAIRYNVRVSDDPTALRAKVVAVLAEYYQNPDARLVVGETFLDGNELPLSQNEDGTVSIAPLDSARPETAPPPPDGDPANLAVGADPATQVPAVELPADPPAEETAPPVDPPAETPAEVTEAAKTLGNGEPEAADSAAGKTLAKHKQKGGHAAKKGK